MKTKLLPSLLGLAAVLATGTASASTVQLPPALSSWTCLGSCGASAADGDISLSPLGNARYGFVSTAQSDAFGSSVLQLDPGGKGNGIENNGSRYSSAAFSAAAGEVLDMRFNYVSTDGKGYDDYAWARVVDASDGRLVAWLFTARSSNSSTGKIVPGDVLRKSDFDPDLMIVDYDQFEFHSKDVNDQVDWSPLGASNQTCWRDNAPGCGYTGWLQSRYSFAQGGSFRIELGVVNWGDSAYDSGLAFDFSGLVGDVANPVPEPATASLCLLGGALLGWRLRRQRQAGSGAAAPASPTVG